MNELRTVEDRLRAEYFQLIPDMQRTLVALEADVRHHLLPVMIALNRYEQVRIGARLKECESAIDSLRRRQQTHVSIPRALEPTPCPVSETLLPFECSCFLATDESKCIPHCFR